MTIHRHLALAFAAVFALGLVADAQAKRKNKAEDERPVSPFTTTEDGDVTQVTVDINDDGVPDIWSYYVTGADLGASSPMRREIDLNRDGRPDMVAYYNGAELVKEEIDADFDGLVDWTSYYEEGRRIRSEWDTDYDGRTDMYKYYNRGRIERIEQDQLLPRDGEIDYWEYYDRGMMKRIGRDLDGDGSIDQWGE